MGTSGGEVPSAGFSWVPGIAADDEVMSSSPLSVPSVGSGGKGFDVEDGVAELYVGSSVGFTVEEVESAFKVSAFGYTHTLVAANGI